MELYLGLFVTALVLYITWLFYKDDYNDFFKFWENYVLLIKSQVVHTRYVFTNVQYESIKVI